MKVHLAEVCYYDANYNDMLYKKVKPNEDEVLNDLRKEVKGVKWQIKHEVKLNDKQMRLFNIFLKNHPEYVVITNNVCVDKQGNIIRH